MARDSSYPVAAFPDNRGIKADRLDIQLSDHDDLLVIPLKDATVRQWLG